MSEGGPQPALIIASSANHSSSPRRPGVRDFDDGLSYSRTYTPPVTDSREKGLCGGGPPTADPLLMTERSPSEA